MSKFDDENNIWVNSEEAVILPDMDYPVPILNDELLINSLKKQRQDDSILELDIAYLNSAINDREYDKPLIPRLCMLVDARKGLILSQNMVTPGDDVVESFYQFKF
ncbi:DUF6930 domain-containing protein [Clostridium saccharoperbutylacetonicum]